MGSAWGRNSAAPPAGWLGGRRGAAKKIFALIAAPLLGALLWDSGVLVGCAAGGRAPARLVPRGAVIAMPEDLGNIQAQITLDVVPGWLGMSPTWVMRMPSAGVAGSMRLQ